MLKATDLISDLVLPDKTAQFHRQGEGETPGWVLIAFL
jgi:hypothetical protein